MIDHPAVVAVREAKRRLSSMMSPSGRNLSSVTDRAISDEEAPLLVPTFRREQVERVLRVEYCRAEEVHVMRALRAEPEIAAMFSGDPRYPGPLVIEGVSWYVVPCLPKPGWRVVNPMEPQP